MLDQSRGVKLVSSRCILPYRQCQIALFSLEHFGLTLHQLFCQTQCSLGDCFAFNDCRENNNQYRTMSAKTRADLFIYIISYLFFFCFVFFHIGEYYISASQTNLLEVKWKIYIGSVCIREIF